MERDSRSGDGGNERGSRSGDGGNERGSWSDEIDLLRRDSERDSWSGLGGPFHRDSHSDDHAGVGNLLMGDSFSGDGDHIVSPLVRGSQPVYSNGDLQGFERDRKFEENPYFSGEEPNAKDYYLDFERDRLLRLGNERDWQPTKAYERLSVDRAHTMKDFEKQITELKKENFNLKLRIYFLEEQVQRHCDNSSEDLHRMNIELKVEVESLKHEFQEKQNLLVRASKAMESMAGEHTFALQQLKEEQMKLLRDLEESHLHKVQLLAEEVKQEKAEVEKVCMLLDQERMQRFSAEERLVAVKEQYSKSMGILEERDWIIQCLNETLHSKDALIAQLEKQINTMMPNVSPTSESPSRTVGGLFTEHEIKEGSGLTCKECLSTRSSGERQENIDEWQKKIKEMENLVSELQQKLEGNKAGFATEEKNALKRDKAIQGLTLALKKKTKENEKLLKDIDNLNAALAKATQTVQCDQSQNLIDNSHPDYKKLLITIEAQQGLCSRLHEYERESGSLQKELDAILMLRQWLEKDIQANQELRKMLEAQIMAKYRESDTFSYVGDQTSYMSICLNQNNEYFDGNVEAASRPPMRSAETQTMAEESLSNAQALFTMGQQEETLGLSVTEEVTAKEEKATAIAMDCKQELTIQTHNTVSSATQTEMKYYADKGILVDICPFGKEASRALAEGETVVADSENFQMSSEVGKRSSELQKVKQHKCLSNNLTKSKIPILLKSLNTRLKLEPDLTPHDNAHICLEKELHEENCRLYEQLRSAEMEIEALKTNQEKPGELSHGLDNPFVAETKSSGQILLDVQWPEEAGLSKELKCGHANVVNSPPAGDLSIQKASLPDLEASDKLEREFLQLELHKQLQLENDRLLEQLKQAQVEIERLQLHEIDTKHTDTKPVLDNADTLERGLLGHSLQGDMQLENLQLTEQLRCAQMDIQRLKMTKGILEAVSSVSDLEKVNTKEKGSSEQSLIKELQLENHQLAEQLKCAQVEIEKLREEKVLLEDLDSMDARDRDDSEHSFLDKTITNSVSEIHNRNSDLEVQVDNFTGQNIVGLRCHHDNYCVECANNQETLILQTSSFKKVSTIESECKLLKISSANRSFEDASLSKYDLLVQSQARELSHHRQKIKESHNLSVVCSKNFINIIKAFEDLIPCTGLDTNIALGFREQLTQTVEWLKELEYKLSDAYYGEEDANSDHSTDSLLNTPSRLVPGHRMWADKHGCHVLGLVEDYNALQKQISEAKTVLQETEAFIDHGVQTAVLNMTDHFGNVFFEKLNRTKQSLEEANCLLKLLWRVSLPLQTRSSYNVRQAEETNLEIIQLRKRVVEQEKLLSGMVKRVYSETQMKEDIEKLILDQLAMTHEILKRAKVNLQVQVVDQRA